MLVALSIVARVASADAPVLSDVDAADAGLRAARFFAGVAPEVARSNAIRECGSDLACMGGALSDGLGLEIAINTGTDPALVSLVLFDRSGKDLAHALVETEPEAKAIASAIEARTTDLLLAGGLARGGRLISTAIPSGALLTVGGAPVAEQTQVLAPGRYEVMATLEGYEPSAATVELEAGKEVTVELRLEPEASLVESPWLWVGIGAAVAVGTAIAVAVAVPKEAPVGPICQAADPSSCR